MHQRINPVEIWPPREDVVIDRGPVTEQFTTINGYGVDNPATMFSDLDARYAGTSQTIGRMDIIGRINNWHPGQQSDYCFNCNTCPMNHKDASHTCPVTGIQVHAVSGSMVQPIWLGGQIVGTVFEDEHARYCQLKDLHPSLKQATPGEQSYELFELFEAALKQAGMTFEHVVRVWLFCDDILDWYDDLNAARDRFFKKRGVYDRFVPASTAVGGSNIHGTKLTGDIFAVQAKEHGHISTIAVDSPLQGPAWDYGSGFSRAAEVITPTHRRLYVSGTGSIDKEGNTIHLDDVDGQIEHTFNVVHAILKSRDMDWCDVTRAVAYVRHQHDLLTLATFCLTNDMPQLPIIIARNTICRDDLLWEIELDAISTSP